MGVIPKDGKLERSLGFSSMREVVQVLVAMMLELSFKDGHL